MTLHRSITPVLAALSLLPSCLSQTPKAGPYHVAQTYKLGVSGGYDYMTFDAATGMLYIAQGTQMLVFDTAKGVVAGTMTGLIHAHGVVLDKDGVTAYISDGGAGTVQIFNRSTLEKTGTVVVGTNPDGMVLEPTTGHLFVFNGKSKNLSVIDLAEHKVIATVPLPGKPEFPTTDGNGNVFVNIEDTHQVLKIVAADNTVAGKWTLTGCEGPSGMAIDTANARIFPVCDNAKIPVVDTSSGTIVATLPIGPGPDAAAYDVERNLVFSSNGDAGTLSILKQKSPDVYTPLQTVKTLPKGRTLALNPTTGDVYVIAPALGSTQLVLLKISK